MNCVRRYCRADFYAAEQVQPKPAAPADTRSPRVKAYEAMATNEPQRRILRYLAERYDAAESGA